MPGFFGYRSVLADLHKHLRRTGKVVEAVLHPSDDAADDVEYTYAYEWPINRTTGIGGVGYDNGSATITLWRTGETTAPLVDMRITVAGRSQQQVVSVTSRLNADEASNFAVYDLTVVS